jgi:membrane associated rhomboid family serine protease
MFIPYGDDLQRKTFPLIPLFLILFNVGLLAHSESIIYHDNEKFEGIAQFFGTFGLVPERLAEGQLFGLFSYMFLHGDLMHLIGNMVILWAFACSLEALMGRFALVVCYFGWGIVGGLAHVGMNWGSEIPLVGASGAVAGLIGAYTVAFGPFARLKCLFLLGFLPIRIQIPAALFGIGWFLLQLMEASDVGMQNISWYAHIGGFLAGAATMVFFRSEVSERVVQGKDGVTVGENLGVTSAVAATVADVPRAPVGEAYIAMRIAEEQALMQQAFNRLQPKTETSDLS